MQYVLKMLSFAKDQRTESAECASFLGQTSKFGPIRPKNENTSKNNLMNLTFNNFILKKNDRKNIYKTKFNNKEIFKITVYRKLQ